MTHLRIDINKFKAICEKVRFEWANSTPEQIALMNKFGGIASNYRFAIENDPIHTEQPASVEVDREAELRSSLRVASRAAQQHGATEAQIEFIVALAVKNNDFNILSGGLLTKGAASNIISSMANDNR